MRTSPIRYTSFSPVGRVFGFEPVQVSFLLMMGIILMLYIIAAEVGKRIFYRKVSF